jgi:hypothetical protein
MPGMGFEPTTPVFERAKTVHALVRSAIVIGKIFYKQEIFCVYKVLNENHLSLFFQHMEHIVPNIPTPFF